MFRVREEGLSAKPGRRRETAPGKHEGGREAAFCFCNHGHYNESSGTTEGVRSASAGYFECATM